MLRPIALTLALTAATLTPAISATLPVTEDEAHAIGVEAYLYFYSLDHHGHDAQAAHQSGAEPGWHRRPDEPLRQHRRLSHRRHEGGGPAEFRHALLQRLARSDQGADGRLGARYRRPLLPVADARHVDRRVRLAGLAHHRHRGRQLSRHAPWLAPDCATSTSSSCRNTQRIDAPTPYVWIIGRTKTDGPADYDAVHKIQAGYKITPLSQWGKAPEPAQARRSIPRRHEDAAEGPGRYHAGRMFFAYAAELLKLQPPHITDQPIIAQLKRHRLRARQELRPRQGRSGRQEGLESAPEDAQKLMAWKVPTLARIANGWSMNTDTMGVYGNYYLKRAIVAQLGLGANLPEDAIYPLNLADETGKPLDGANNYTLHFDKGQTPPVNAFWSVTLYDTEAFRSPIR